MQAIASQRLDRHPFAAEFRPEHRAALAALIKEVRFAPGKVIFVAAFDRDPAFGLAFMLRLMAVVSERLRATRLQVLDMYSPVARRAGA